MKRFIRYLYEYEKDKRIRNVGFIKVETGCEETIVHLQGKGFHDREERKLVLYLFYAEKDEIVGIQQGEMLLNSPVLGWSCTFSVDDVGGQENYSKICGILIETGSGRRIAATWDDRCVDVSQMRMAVAEEKCFAEEETGLEEEKAGREVLTEGKICPDPENPELEEEKSGPVAQEKQILTQQRVSKITRQDISRLPRCEWKLANNQFLMHGYNNFHHLLLIDDGNYLKLGVPGIYHIKEAKCADIFGFGEFISIDEKDSGFEDQSEIFGYWCRPVRRPRYR